AHRVTDHLVLVAHGRVRLVVTTQLQSAQAVPTIVAVAGPRCRPRACFDIEVVWLLTALVDEVATQLEIARLASRAVQPNQRQLDFGMTTVATLLVRPGAEDARDVIGVAAHDVEHCSSTGGLKVGDAGFDQVAGAIQLVAIAQISPAL